jgi:hypothetical protein
VRPTWHAIADERTAETAESHKADKE